MMAFQLLRLLVLVCMLQVAMASSSSSSYTPVTALDKYGNSIQLKHAREAALRYGRLIVAAHCVKDDAVVVFSVYTPKLGRSHKHNSVLERLLLADDTASCYLACTGVKADATWLIATMRQYSSNLWERYNVNTLSVERTSQAVSQTLLEFMGYNRSLEYHDGVRVTNNNDEEDSSWARPLGIQTLVVSSDSITLVEPSGIAQPNVEYVAIGKDSAAIQRSLRERYRADLSLQEIQELLLSTIRDTVEGQAKAELVVEVVSKDGVDVSTVPLRSRKQ